MDLCCRFYISQHGIIKLTIQIAFKKTDFSQYGNDGISLSARLPRSGQKRASLTYRSMKQTHLKSPDTISKLLLAFFDDKSSSAYCDEQHPGHIHDR